MTIRPPLIAVALLLAPLPVLAQSYPWQANLRLVDVRPNDSSSSLAQSPATLEFSSGGALELGISYAFLPEWTAELSWQRAGLDVDVTSPEASPFRAGSADLSVTSLTLQYRFFVVGRIRPYVGLGAHLASISGFKPSEMLVAGNVDAISFDRSASVTVQAGVDYDVTDRISVTADVKYHDVGTDATLTLPSGDPWQTARVDIDPWALAIGAGFRF